VDSDICQALPGGITQQGSVDVMYTVDDCLGNDLIELKDQYDSDGAFVYNRQNCLNVTGRGLQLVHFSAQYQPFFPTEATASVHFSTQPSQPPPNLKPPNLAQHSPHEVRTFS